MKTIVQPKFAPLAVLAGSVLGFLLRLWTLGSGPNALGLYEPMIFPWCLLVLLSLAMAGLILLCTARLKNAGTYEDHFPASMLGAASSLLAAVAVLLSTFRVAESAAAGVWIITVLLGVGSAIALGIGALSRYVGSRPPFWVHALPCLFFALRIFLYCRSWGNVPQTGIFLFPFLASICVLFAVYQLTCYDVDMGNRRRSLFWSLFGVYLCIVAAASSDDLFFYLSMAAFLLTNHCCVLPIHRPKPVDPTTEGD